MGRGRSEGLLGWVCAVKIMGSGLGGAWAIEKEWMVERRENKGCLYFSVVRRIFFGCYYRTLYDR